MADTKAVESDVDLNDSMTSGSRSNFTTDDELFDQLMKLPVKAPNYLIPDKCQDETEAQEHILECFGRRYQNYPLTYVGKLSEALKDAFKVQQLADRRPLLIFVNHDKSIYGNLFFKQLLCQTALIEYLAQDYLFWAWDVTFSSNCYKLNEIFKNAFPGSSNQINFKTDNPDLYPILIGVYRNVQGEFVYERLLDGTLRQPNLDELLNFLRQFKEKFVQNERDLEKRRETVKEEMAARAAGMRRHHFKRYHSIHPNLHGPRDYRAYLSMDRSAMLQNPELMADLDDFSSEDAMYMELAHKFERVPKTPEDADDEDDDFAQTPTVERPEPTFQRVTKP